LIDASGEIDSTSKQAGNVSKPKAKPKRSPSPTTVPQKRKASPGHEPSTKSPSPVQRRKPSFHDPTTQLPLRDPESPSRSPTPDEEPSKSKSSASNLQAEIAALKASMRRTVATATDTSHKKSALEALIPPTSTRGRKRPRPGESNAKEDANALKILNAFKARLESSSASKPSQKKTNGEKPHGAPQTGEGTTNDDNDDNNNDEEAQLCDLHFIANCQSCSRWDEQGAQGPDADTDDDTDWLSHTLSFAKDRLGKDLTWKKKNEEELVVIDPREKERELKTEKRRDRDRGKPRDKDKGKSREGRW